MRKTAPLLPRHPLRGLAPFLALAAVVALGACATPSAEAPRISDPFADATRPPRSPGARLIPQQPGAAMAAQFRAQAGDTVLFPTDDANLTPQARAVLARQADWLTGNPNWRAVIEGHAAEDGTREYNLSLGARRASSVQDYLIAHGVNPDRLRTVSFGKERPLQACATEACHAANRRAVTTLQPAGMI